MHFGRMMFMLAAAAIVAVVVADCPTGCPKMCPAQDSVQSDFVRNHFDINKFWGTFYDFYSLLGGILLNHLCLLRFAATIAS